MIHIQRSLRDCIDGAQGGQLAVQGPMQILALTRNPEATRGLGGFRDLAPFTQGVRLMSAERGMMQLRGEFRSGWLEKAGIVALALNRRLRRIPPEHRVRTASAVDVRKLGWFGVGELLRRDAIMPIVAIVDDALDMPWLESLGATSMGQEWFVSEKTRGQHGNRVAAAALAAVGEAKMGIISRVVFDGSGFTSDATVLSALAHIAEHDRVHAVNLSLGTPTDDDNPIYEAVFAELRRKGIVSGGAAGNEPGPLSSPARESDIATAAANSARERLASWSASAPAQPQTSTVTEVGENLLIKSPDGTGSCGGTSFASPQTVGRIAAVSALLQAAGAKSEVAAAEAKRVFLEACRPLGAADHANRAYQAGQGWGLAREKHVLAAFGTRTSVKQRRASVVSAVEPALMLQARSSVDEAATRLSRLYPGLAPLTPTDLQFSYVSLTLLRLRPAESWCLLLNSENDFFLPSPVLSKFVTPLAKAPVPEARIAPLERDARPMQESGLPEELESFILRHLPGRSVVARLIRWPTYVVSNSAAELLRGLMFDPVCGSFIQTEKTHFKLHRLFARQGPRWLPPLPEWFLKTQPTYAGE